MFRVLDGFISRIIWLLLLAGLVLFTYVVTVDCYRGLTCKHWPVTQGVVFAFYETPNYRYAVSGRSYVSDQVSCNEFLNRSLTAQNSAKYAVRYPLEAKVSVRYHPGTPQLAVLETKFDTTVLWAIPILLFFTVMSAFGFVLGWRWRMRWRLRIS